MNGKMWMISCSLNVDEMKWVESDYKTKSMMLLKYYVESYVEYAPNQISVWNSGGKNLMLIIKDWKCVHEIVDPNAGNVQKSFMMTLPDFDPEEFPFMLCSGQEAYTLLNVKEGIFYPFLKGSALNSRVQQPAFFTVVEGDGIIVHFSTKRLDQSNYYENDYSTLKLRKDFVDVLKAYKRPCFPTVKSSLEAWKEAGGVEKVPNELGAEEATKLLELAKKDVEAYKNVTATSKKTAEEAKKDNEAKAKTMQDLKKKNDNIKQDIHKLRSENATFAGGKGGVSDNKSPIEKLE